MMKFLAHATTRTHASSIVSLPTASASLRKVLCLEFGRSGNYDNKWIRKFRRLRQLHDEDMNHDGSLKKECFAKNRRWEMV